MNFDRELIFVKSGKLTASEGGPVGSAIDLGTGGQLRGRPSYVAIASEGATTATGAPVISFALEFADTPDFAGAVAVPLSLPPLGKGDLAEGKAVIAPSPVYSRRYVRLSLTTDIAITCANITAGFVLDPQTNAIF
jgi:hypothetical protein